MRLISRVCLLLLLLPQFPAQAQGEASAAEDFEDYETENIHDQVVYLRLSGGF